MQTKIVTKDSLHKNKCQPAVNNKRLTTADCFPNGMTGSSDSKGCEKIIQSVSWTRESWQQVNKSKFKKVKKANIISSK